MNNNARKTARTDPLQHRRKPIQARAQESRDRILEVASQLLDEVGIDNFNTNLLAERANIRVRTIYRYFPNKFSVLATIGEDMFERWKEWNAEFFEEIARPGSDWTKVLQAMLEGWVDRLASEKGARALLNALGAVPQLRELDVAAYASLVQDFESAIRRRVPDTKQDLTALSHVITSAIYGLIDCYFRSPESVRPLMAAELAHMIAGRLRETFEAD